MTTIDAPRSDDQDVFMKSWFPDLDSKSYMIPVVHVDYFFAKSTIIGDVPASELWLKSYDAINTAAEEIREYDETHKIVHSLFNNIKDHTAKEEVMVMMTQVSFRGDSGSKPKSLEDIKYKKRQLSDLVIVSKHRGVLVGVVQSAHASDLILTESVLKRSVANLAELARSVQEVVRTVPGADNVAVHTTLILSNITRNELEKQFKELQKAVQGVPCLCKDEMVTDKDLKRWWQACWSPELLHSDVYRHLVTKFAKRATSVEIYLTTQPRLQLKHEHDVVDAVGDFHGAEIFQAGLNQLSLFPKQAQLLGFDYLDDTMDDVKFLWGPPGTGKTVVLVLRALQWVHHCSARHIVILQTRQEGTAASCLVEYQLQQTLNAQQQRARQCGKNSQSAQCTFTHVDISELSSEERNKPAYNEKEEKSFIHKVIMKEIWKEKLSKALGLQQRGQSDTAIHIVADEADGDVVAAVYQWLKERVTIIRLWAAGVDAFRENEKFPASQGLPSYRMTIPSDQSDSNIRCMNEKKGDETVYHYHQFLIEGGTRSLKNWSAGHDFKKALAHKNIPASVQRAVCEVTEPLRCPWPVVLEATKTVQISGGKVPRYEMDREITGEPTVVTLKHNKEGSQGHTSLNPWRCGQCANNIVASLRSLHVDDAFEGRVGLSSNDVLILGSNIDCDTPDDHDQSPAPLVGSLQDNKFNVRTLSSTSSRDEVMAVVKRDFEPPAVTIANVSCVLGLERKIVVYCESADHTADDDLTERLWALTRSTSKLIYIKSVKY